MRDDLHLLDGSLAQALYHNIWNKLSLFQNILFDIYGDWSIPATEFLIGRIRSLLSSQSSDALSTKFYHTAVQVHFDHLF